MQTKSYWRATVLAVSLVLSMLIPVVMAEADGGKRVRSDHGHNVFTWKPRHRSDAITVMTQNVYVGADVDAILEVQDPNDIPLAVAVAFQELLSTDFFERAATIAEQIARTRPHLIGLQEISLIRVQSPGDALSPEPTPAEEVLLDYLSILLQALRDRHLHYQVVGKIQNADVELPMLASPDPLAFDDVRLTDFDVVLARRDVQVSQKSVVEQNYAKKLIIPGTGIKIPRGYVAVDARIKHRTYRFVNTHLEPATPGVRLKQAGELLDVLADEKKPVIVVGDFNTPAPTGQMPTGGQTYQAFVSAGFVDVWTRNLNKSEGEGFTFSHDSDLRNTVVDLNERIDLIFVRNRVRGQTLLGPVFAKVWGDELRERTPSGLWPSDHAGVIARLRLPAFRRW